jgi:C1A family cysteine protease
MNKFADLTTAEYAKYMGLKKHAPKVRDTTKFMARAAAKPIAAPAAIDWRDLGVVNDIKDQGQCGSCWAFSATSAFESAYAIATGNLLDLSEQEVVDCDVYGLDQGCNGGFMDQAFECVILQQSSSSSADATPFPPPDLSSPTVARR